MKILKACGLMLALLVATGASANESAMKELNPTGKLRVALVFAPSMSIFFVVKENDKPRGVTADPELATLLPALLTPLPQPHLDTPSGGP